MHRLIIVMALAIMPFLATTTRAQDALECPEIFAAGGLDANATPDITHQPLAYPGAFGGEVSCLLKQTNNGTELFFVEVIPFDGEISQAFEYRARDMVYSVKTGEQNARYIEVAGCFDNSDGGFLCWADIGFGKSVNVIMTYNADSDLVNAQFLVDPENGVIPTEAWQRLQQEDPTGETLSLSFFLGKAGAQDMLPLKLVKRGAGNAFSFSVDGQPAYEFLLAQTNENFEIIATTLADLTEKTNLGSSVTSNRYTYTISPGTTAFLINRLFQLKDLMAAGYEDSKTLDFSR